MFIVPKCCIIATTLPTVSVNIEEIYLGICCEAETANPCRCRSPVWQLSVRYTSERRPVDDYVPELDFDR